ncbi:alcohol dehydrogenase catalytic domain-containing protein [Streptosporangium lutulentum]
MRALVMTSPGGSENSHVRETDEPRPGPGEVSIDVAYAGLNFMDVMARRGDAGYATSWPYRPGLEVSGTVREVGAGVAGLAAGDRVAAVPAGGGWPRSRWPARSWPSRCRPTCRCGSPPRPLGLTTALLLLEAATSPPATASWCTPRVAGSAARWRSSCRCWAADG